VTKNHGKIVMTFHMKNAKMYPEMIATMYLIKIVIKYHGKIVTKFIPKFQSRFLKKDHSGFVMDRQEAIMTHTDIQIKKLLITTLLNCELEL